jgi:anti-sigma B factor antagonist
MALDITEQHVGGVTVLKLVGRLTLGPDVSAFDTAMEAVFESGTPHILLDASELVSMDSSGLGTLVGWHSRLKKADGAIAFLGLSKKNVQLLVLTRLATLFPIFDDQELAIDSFFPGRQRKQFNVLEFVKDQNDEPVS